MSTPRETKGPVAKALKTRKPPARVQDAPSAIGRVVLGSPPRERRLHPELYQVPSEGAR